ncbi:hypothetical protein BGX24_011091 [Mortierella sp. AD032]|nr:hypothetical protein BGX24_011091 [Mortierella sp. AD032]
MLSASVLERALSSLCNAKSKGVIGVGIDVLHMPRLKAVLGRRPDRFLTRVLTKAELGDFQKLKDEVGGQVDHDRAVQFVGARWALKEATYKALTPLHKLTWQDVTVIKDQGTEAHDNIVATESGRYVDQLSHC